MNNVIIELEIPLIGCIQKNWQMVNIDIDRILTEEVWREVPGYENYQVSSHSRIYNSTTNRFLGQGKKSTGYIGIGLRKGDKTTGRALHTLLAEIWFTNPDGKRYVDHRDGNPRNNALSNLRWATHTENMRNRRVHKNNKLGVKGVTYYKSSGKYRAHISYGGKQRHLGYYSTAEEAHEAYCAAAEEHHGEFARFE